jgi:DNA-binding winged helix-turn-helix (wHTH) protein
VHYRFGQFTLDIATRQLFSHAAEVHLSPKAFDLLSTLVGNRARALSKAELQQQLWPDTFVEETNLAGLVSEIRRALHDPASVPMFVRTVYGFGYRFIAETHYNDDARETKYKAAKLFLVWDRRELMLADGANVIGRGADATIRIDSPGVSRHHARIVVAGREALLEDVESKNGTFLNGSRITSPRGLADGDEIRLGRIVMAFRIATPTSPTTTVLDD